MTVEAFTVRSERSGFVHRLTPAGDLDVSTVPILAAEFDLAFNADETTVIVLDLTQLAFMDSSGIGLLIRLNDRPGDRLRVVNGSRAVERVLDLAGVRPLLPLIAKDDEAIALLKERRQRN